MDRKDLAALVAEEERALYPAKDSTPSFKRSPNTGLAPPPWYTRETSSQQQPGVRSLPTQIEDDVCWCVPFAIAQIVLSSRTYQVKWLHPPKHGTWHLL